MNALVQPHIAIDGIEIRTDAQGRFCLNDLHKASGSLEKNKPKFFLENKQTQALVQELTEGGIPSSQQIQPVSVTRGGLEQGTYVVKELVYSYAMWISPSFNLKVIRTFDSVATSQNQPVFDISNPYHLLQAIETQAKQNIELTQKVEKLEPKAQALDTIADTDNTYCLREVAKTIGIKQKDLIALLLLKKWIYRESNGRLQPYSIRQDQGIFINRPSPIVKNKNTGEELIHLHMRVTAFGLTRITGLVNKEKGFQNI
ncbi:phage antirepressor KilAC domain-containing protein [Acinetobacter sp. SwsAc5]|uniref:KilA-N domain-containing protein n=1 Tax=Acinetobacter sp. SwsAc5 TaxID=2749438 RepID=UPI0015BFF808|nr:KilA-N domain-containing protein [Acinetobacter sp. SwsAc5]NWK52155.1 phage antirepressor KilAC domain-containing protein [Acinetobacter sp. SwsAc5]